MDDLECINIEKLKQGEIKALEDIFYLYSLSLTRYAFHFVNDEERAKDMVQEVFYKLWRDREHLTVDTSLEAFLYTCVKNECLNFLKHERIRGKYAWFRKRLRAIEIQQYDYEDPSQENLRMEELQEKIDSILESLPDKSRQIFKMSRFEEKKNKEIAEELDISLKAVEKHITRALKHLKKHLRKNYK